MGIYTKKSCQHGYEYEANSRVLFMTLVTSCVECYLDLYTKLYKEENIQIHQMRVFDKKQWKREGKRLQRIRMCFNINPNCEKLGIECDFKKPSHGLKLATEIPVNLNMAKKMIRFSSFACFPKYKGLGETQYKKLITRRKKNIERSITKTKEYLDWEGICYECGLDFDNKVKLKEHLAWHIELEYGM